MIHARRGASQGLPSRGEELAEQSPALAGEQAGGSLIELLVELEHLAHDAHAAQPTGRAAQRAHGWDRRSAPAPRAAQSSMNLTSTSIALYVPSARRSALRI